MRAGSWTFATPPFNLAGEPPRRISAWECSCETRAIGDAEHGSHLAHGDSLRGSRARHAALAFERTIASATSFARSRDSSAAADRRARRRGCPRRRAAPCRRLAEILEDRRRRCPIAASCSRSSSTVTPSSAATSSSVARPVSRPSGRGTRARACSPCGAGSAPMKSVARRRSRIAPRMRMRA